MKTRFCEFEGCDKKHSAKGYCAGHYYQLYRGEELRPLRIKIKYDGCSFEGCDREEYANGYCQAHDRQRRHGEEIRELRKIRRPRKNLKGMTDQDIAEHNAMVNKRNKLRMIGWTPEMVESAILLQNGTCANPNCSNPVNLTGLDSGADHDHETGEARGMMCSKCNMALGLLGEDPETIRGLAIYAEQCLNARSWLT